MIEKIGVIGAGTMGHGIAQVFAQAGYEVTLLDQSKSLAETGFSKIESNLHRAAEKGKLDQAEAGRILARIHPTGTPADLASAHLVVEAAVEQLKAKPTIFSELDSLCPASTIFASNTSSLPITLLASFTKRADRFIGMHFMNPPPIMKLVEVIRGHLTSPETTKTIVALCEKLGKTPVEANDYPGFIANRIL